MMSQTKAQPAVLLLLLFKLSAGNAQHCLDNTGNRVDWWFTYKFNDGFNFAYADSNGKALSLSPFGLDSSNAALIRTLQNMVPMHQQSPNNKTGNVTAAAGDASYFMYNDQPDNDSPSSSYGHTKGVVGIGASESMWLLHSTPNFPPSQGGSFAFPARETEYGQTYLCMSIATSSINAIAGQFLYSEPYVYVNTVPTTVSDNIPNLALLLSKKFNHSAGTNVASFKTLAGVQFTSLIKNKEWDMDMYEDLVAPYLNQDLIVESWMRGQKLGPYCKPKSKYQVTDVQTMQISAVTWKETQDHAKWCVPVSPSSNYLCVCDTNRMTSQRKRGGGCVCFEDQSLSTAIRNAITQYDESCASSTHLNATRVDRS